LEKYCGLTEEIPQDEQDRQNDPQRDEAYPALLFIFGNQSVTLLLPEILQPGCGSLQTIHSYNKH
jgi:hypothetical protein